MWLKLLDIGYYTTAKITVKLLFPIYYNYYCKVKAAAPHGSNYCYQGQSCCFTKTSYPLQSMLELLLMVVEIKAVALVISTTTVQYNLG